MLEPGVEQSPMGRGDADPEIENFRNRLEEEPEGSDSRCLGLPQ